MQLVDQNTSLKKEAGIAERKLLARNERIQNLEALMSDADRRLAIQNQKFEAQLQAVKERLEQARGMSPVCSPSFALRRILAATKAASSGSSLSFGRIAKPLRGGGGLPAASGTSPGIAGSPVVPSLSRVSEDG